MVNHRIEATTNEVSVVLPNRKSNEKINGIDIKEYEKQMQASYDKATSLIKYRNRIKVLVAESNATTEVIIDGDKMTIAEAIER